MAPIPWHSRAGGGAVHSINCGHDAKPPRQAHCLSIVAPRGASASAPSDTPASVANGRSGHADTANSCPAWPASVGDLIDYAVGRVSRRDRKCLR
jgi:hypothetical protein